MARRVGLTIVILLGIVAFLAWNNKRRLTTPAESHVQPVESSLLS